MNAQPNTITTPRAAIYCRISADDQRDELGVKRQERNCRELIDRKGWTLAGVYIDNNITASKINVRRPQFERLMSDVALGNVDLVIVQNQDRLTRLTDQLEQIARALRAAGHRAFWTVTAGEVPIESSNARLGYRVKGLFDAAYSEFISEKVREKKRELAEAGMPIGGGNRRPFGYDETRMRLVPREAKLVCEAAQRIIEGDSLTAIAKDWTKRKIPTVSGATWVPNVVRGILLSPRIAGLSHTKGEIIGPAQWPAILDRKTWERVRAILSEPGRGRPRSMPGRGRHLLTGLMVCGRCGAPMVSAANNGKRSYRCNRNPGVDGCGRVDVAAEPLEELIIETVLLRLDDAPLAAEVRKVTKASRADASPTGDITDLEQRKVDLAEAFAAGDIDRAQLVAASKRLDGRLAELRGRLEGIEVPDPLAPFRGKRKLLRRRWPTLDMQTRRAILAAVIEKITVAPVIVRGRHTFDPDRVKPSGGGDVVWRV